MVGGLDHNVRFTQCTSLNSGAGLLPIKIKYKDEDLPLFEHINHGKEGKTCAFHALLGTDPLKKQSFVN